MIDKWRYACVECGSVSVRKSTRKSVTNLNAACDGYAEYWFCNGCSTSYPQVYDKKFDVIVEGAQLAPHNRVEHPQMFKSWPGGGL